MKLYRSVVHVTACIGQITCTYTDDQESIVNWKVKKYKWQAKQDFTLKDGKVYCFCTQAHNNWNMVILSHFVLDSEILQGNWQKLLKDVYFNWKYNYSNFVVSIAIAWTYLYFWINAETILCIKKHSDFWFTCLSN